MGKTITPKTKLVVVREPNSYKVMEGKVPNATKLFMGADLSFSFPVSRASLEYWERYYTTLGYAGSTLVFSRANNFGKGVKIISPDNYKDNHTVHLEVLSSRGGSFQESFPLSQIVFASSSVIEDWGHFQTLAKDYGPKQKSTKTSFVMCEQVEQLWALIKISRAVFTDRYHPGVAARIHNVPMQVLVYKSEQHKLAGLMQLSNTSAVEMRNLNQEAFQLLLGFLQQYTTKSLK
jgi:polysaccharide pyruvyl transferase WcaK-like protein